MKRPSGVTAERIAKSLAATSAALVEPYDVIGFTTHLLLTAVDATSAAAGGLILRRLGQDRLNLLAATSHRAQQLELYQTQSAQGPCFDAVQDGEPTFARDSESIRRRWPALAEQFEKAGYHGVHATPLTWHGDAIGALNLFWTDDRAPGASGEVDGIPADTDLLATFANLATMAIVNAEILGPTTVLTRTRAALDERTILEQAKGVIAERRQVPMDVAFDILMETADNTRQLIGTVAREIVSASVTERPSADADR